MDNFSNLNRFGINLEDIRKYEILCLPEKINSTSDIHELRDTTDSILFFKLLKEGGINCGNSYSLGLDIKVYERRSIDLWLGTIYIFKVVSIPLFIAILGRLIGAKIEELALGTKEKLGEKIHVDINIEDEKLKTSIKFKGDSENLLKILNKIYEENKSDNN